jgi:DNA-binding MarR family transcriptional regulator
VSSQNGPAPRARRGGPRIAGLLNLALEQALAAIDGHIAERHPDLRAAHLRLFRFGSIEGHRITALAAEARMTKQSMHELVTHLEQHGYLTREPDPRDVRARVIHLTERGHELESSVIAASARLHLAWREELGAARFDTVWEALRQLTGSGPAQPKLADLRRDARTDERRHGRR